MGRERMRIVRSLVIFVFAGSVLVLAPPAESVIGVSTCPFTATTSVKVVTDLDCTGDGIVVAENGIKIDLGGHTLKGDLGSGDYGIDNSGGSDDVAVVNGTVRNFDRGIFGNNGADRMLVRGIVASGNSVSGIEIINSDASTVRSSQASGNGGFGIELFGMGPHLVAKSKASGNDDGGMLVVGGPARAVVVESAATGNGGTGAEVRGEPPVVKYYEGSGNSLYGLRADGPSAVVKYSKLSGNDNEGLLVIGDSVRVGLNSAWGNGENGIKVTGDAPRIDRNRADANGYPGGVSAGDGLGIFASNYTTPPKGDNVARGNDDPDECEPVTLC
jgi:hypothetical protein